MARYFGVPLRNGLPIGLGSSIGLGGAGGSSAPIPDEYFEYTTLLLPGNGTNGAQNNTFLDSSTNAFSITRNGNTTQGTFSPFSQTGWGNYFDGSGDYLVAPSNAAFQLGTGAFTLECFVYFTGSSTTYFFNNLTNSGVSNTEWALSILSGTDFAFGSYNTVYLTASSAVTKNSWQHVAVVRSGTTLSMFVNGTRVATATNSNDFSSTNGAEVGAYGTGNSPYTGYVSNARVVKGTAVYDPTQTTLTVPTAPLIAISGTSLLTCQSNRFIDNSSNAFAITRNGDVSVQAFSPFNPTAAWSAATNGGSGYYDGSGDYLNTTTNISAIGTGDFTLEVWCYPTASTSYRYFLAIGPDTNFATGLNTGGYAPYLYAGSFILTSSISTVPNAWNHVQYVRSSGTLTVYVNGVSGGSVTWTGSIAAGRGYIGANDSNLYYFFGYHSSLRFSNIARSVSVPTAPYTSDANTQLLTNFTNAGIYDATSKNDLETVGNAQISTTQSKFGGSSIYLDGTGDVLLARNNTLYGFGTGNFTIETWVYIVSGTSFGCVVGGPSGGATWYLEYSSNRGFYFYDGTTALNGSASLVTATWKHLAVSRSGTTLRMFVDGVLTATHTTSSNIPSVLLAIGAYNDNTNNINGYVQDLRITKGYARYTAAFTAPTTAFPVL